jgi:hypothetical protein
MPRTAREKANLHPRSHQVEKKKIHIYSESPSLQAQKHFPINQFKKKSQTAGSAVTGSEADNRKFWSNERMRFRT